MIKLLALISCLFVVSSASYLAAYTPAYGYAHGYGYHGPQHIPIIGPHGVPLEPPANVAARVQHAAAVAEAKARNGDYGYGHAGYGHAGYAGNYGYYGHGYHGPIHLPVIGPGGVPLEPPANVAARVQHSHAVAEAKARNGDYGYGHGLYAGYAGHAYPGAALAYGSYGHGYYGQHIPVIGPHGVPLEPPANVAARALHAAAHAEAAAHSGAYHWGRKRRSVYGAAYYGAGYHGPQHIPIIGPNGVPLEPPANVAARAQHAAAHAKAAGYGAVALYSPGVYAGPYAHGAPHDTPEVAAAKAAHFAAHAEARARTGAGAHYGAYAAPLASPYYGLAAGHISHNGLPLDTPEVAAAKAAHLAVHAAAAHGGHY